MGYRRLTSLTMNYTLETLSGTLSDKTLRTIVTQSIGIVFLHLNLNSSYVRISKLPKPISWI